MAEIRASTMLKGLFEHFLLCNITITLPKNEKGSSASIYSYFDTHYFNLCKKCSSSLLNTVFSSVENSQKVCVMLVDEVYVKKSLQFHGGEVLARLPTTLVFLHIPCWDTWLTVFMGVQIFY